MQRHRNIPISLPARDEKSAVLKFPGEMIVTPLRAHNN